MALIKCSECGKEISDKAAACPHCGNPLNSLFEKPQLDSAEEARREEFERYLMLARRARDDDNNDNAAKYYDMALQKNPLSWEASFYQVFHNAMNCKIIDISSAAFSVANCLDGVFQLIRDEEKPEKQEEAYNEIKERAMEISRLLADGAINHYNRFSQADGAFNDCASRVGAASTILEKLLCAAKKYIPEDRAYISSCAKMEIGLIINRITWFNEDWAIKEFEQLEALAKETDPDYTAPRIEKKAPTSTGGCYIATCVYGSYDCAEVWTLRRYRDYTLSRRWYGRAFIRLYYTFSPAIVKLFGNSNWFKRFWKRKLDPIVADLQSKGVEATPYRDRMW